MYSTRWQSISKISVAELISAIEFDFSCKIVILKMLCKLFFAATMGLAMYAATNSAKYGHFRGET